MKKSLLLLSTLIITFNLFSQKIPKERFEAVFKTKTYWKDLQDQRIRFAPPAALQRINTFNSAALSRGLTFRLAFTSVYGKNIERITGSLIPSGSAGNTGPDPLFNSMPLRANVVRITASAGDSYVDMREFGIVTNVDDQGNCGSCWAFGTIAALETGSLLKNGGDIAMLNLAEQQVLNCTGTGTCRGGYLNDAAKYICTHNITTQTMYPYTAMDGACGTGNSVMSTYKGRRWDWAGESINEIKRAIVEHGSVATAIWVSDEMQAYGGGVYNLENAPNVGKTTNHVVQIVGWDDNLQAWLIKNSWGTTWGEGGFGWIKYGVNHIGNRALWIEAEEFGDMTRVTSNPYTPNMNDVNFETASFATLEGLYNVVQCRIANRQSRKLLDCDDPVGAAAYNNSNKGRRMIQWDSHTQETVFSSDGFNQSWLFLQAGRRGEKPIYKLFNAGFTNFLTDNRSGKPICENGRADDSQLWYIMPQGNKGLVKIKNVATAKYITVPAGNNDNGAEIIMADATTGDNQLFDLNIMNYNPSIPVDVKYFLIPQHYGGLALDVPAGNTANGNALQIWQKINGNTNQIWTLSFQSPYFRMHPLANEGQCIEILNRRVDNGAAVGLWSGWEGRNQEWVIFRMPRDNSKFIIFNRESAKCLDVSGVASRNGTPVVQWEYVNGNNQKWEIKKID